MHPASAFACHGCARDKQLGGRFRTLEGCSYFLNDGIARCAGERSHSFRSPVPVQVQVRQGLKGHFPVILSIATCCTRHLSLFLCSSSCTCTPLAASVAHLGRGAHNGGGILTEIGDRGPRGKGWTTQHCDVRAVAADLHHLVANLANQLRRHTMRRQMQQWHGMVSRKGRRAVRLGCGRGTQFVVREREQQRLARLPSFACRHSCPACMGRRRLLCCSPPTYKPPIPAL